MESAHNGWCFTDTIKIHVDDIEGQIGSQCTWLVLAHTLKMNKLHSCDNANEEGDVLLNLKQMPVNVMGLFMGVLNMDSQVKGP